MNKYIKEIKAYTFPELTGEAKEKAKEWYLNDETLSWELTNNYESDLSCIFPNSDLKVQWSLSYCQGDGVNIYGSVNMEDIFVLSQNAPAYNWIDGYLTEKEIRTLRFYMSEYKNEVKIPVNRRYSYCMADSIDFAEDFRYELENMGIRDIRVSVLEKAERLLKQVFHSSVWSMRSRDTQNSMRFLMRTWRKYANPMAIISLKTENFLMKTALKNRKNCQHILTTMEISV